ncbi:MAG: hypothetical protein JWQ72_149, partial [Polaromonas sp.]|nr:hypothetical protein [Polaromonas sp.]
GDAPLVERWRGLIMDTAMEEMVHLALIANLTVAVGARPHFNRPNLPVPPLYHPADLVVELAPFNLDTLDHFIYLERPDGNPLPDGQSFTRRRGSFERGERPGASLMPGAIDYATVGEFYAHVRECLVALAQDIGEAALFCGDPALQVGPDMADLPGMATISSLAEALSALDTIVTQGEGGSDGDESHFARFVLVRDEVAAFQKRSGRVPAWPAARNPLMRKPSDPASGVHITDPAAAAVLDLGNAVYALTLRLLGQAWNTQGVRDADKAGPRAALNAAMQLMGVLGIVGKHLCSLPAGAGAPGVHAGLSFTVPRAVEALVMQGASLWIGERLGELQQGLDIVAASQPALAKAKPLLGKVATAFAQARTGAV